MAQIVLVCFHDKRNIYCCFIFSVPGDMLSLHFQALWNMLQGVSVCSRTVWALLAIQCSWKGGMKTENQGNIWNFIMAFKFLKKQTNLSVPTLNLTWSNKKSLIALVIEVFTNHSSKVLLYIVMGFGAIFEIIINSEEHWDHSRLHRHITREVLWK